MLLQALQYDNRIFGLDPQLLFQVVFQMLAIFLLFMIASYLLLNPVRKILNDRKERVMREQKEAAQSRDEAVRFKEEYDTKLKQINKEAEQILSEARKKAMQRENEIIADAKTEASRIMDNARKEAELEKKRVKDEVKQEIISVASLMSEKIIAASIDEEKQNALFEQTLQEMGDETWLNG
ncbi:MAG: F0F1 ATP synthase subunit B [Lachnospiraceae bacterium]|nr:F0F1 ATP synthase subunit B [Lachnospiraceae bacterium]MDY5498084.1 F0F1 ATP synthase subunit B [Anaerobutyricum sp.]